MYKFITRGLPLKAEFKPTVVFPRYQKEYNLEKQRQVIEQFEKECAARHHTFGVNIDAKLILIVDPKNDSISKHLRAFAGSNHKNLFVYTCLENIPLLFKHNYFIKYIEIHSLTDKCLFHCIPLDYDFIPTMELHHILKCLGFLVEQREDVRTKPYFTPIKTDDKQISSNFEQLDFIC